MHTHSATRPILGLFVLIVAAVPFRTAGAQTLVRSSANAAAAPLHPGDLVRITVWRQPDLSGEFAVGPDGRLTHPLYRDVQVVGVALPDVELRLRTFLLQYEANPRFAVEPLFRVAIGGEVEKPNFYFLPPGTLIAQAVAMAGGPNERGRRDEVRLVRDMKVFYCNLTHPQSEMLQVASGDQIFVERRRSVFRDFLAPTVVLAGAVAAIINAIQYKP